MIVSNKTNHKKMNMRNFQETTEESLAETTEVQDIPETTEESLAEMIEVQDIPETTEGNQVEINLEN